MPERTDMGIGELGFNNVIFKRKFRFTFDVTGICQNGGNYTIPRHFVKVASRPSLTIEETELNFLNAKTWIPGKAAWETLSVTYIDVAKKDTAPLYHWLVTMYDFNDKAGNTTMATKQDEWSAIGNLKLWDGCGTLVEHWELLDLWPTSVNFGDLDYSSSEEATIEMTFRYSKVHYEQYCDATTPKSCCEGCNPPSTFASIFE